MRRSLLKGGSAHPHIDPSSFSFRLTCYEKYHWTPEDIKKIPYTEALMLSVYFEEESAKQYKDNKKLNSQSNNSSSDGVVEIAIGDDEDDE